MKIKLLFFTFLISIVSNKSFAGYGTYIDGIYYELNDETHTATVTFGGYDYNSSNEYKGDVVIPKTVYYFANDKSYDVRYIGKDAFKNCNMLTSITIPSSIVHIEGLSSYSYNLPFDGCKTLKKIIVEDSNESYSTKDGVLFNKSKSILYVCPEGKTGDYRVPSSVSFIDKMGFVNCCHLASIAIPETVVSIGNFAFSGFEGILWFEGGISDYNDYTFSGMSVNESAIIAPEEHMKSIQKVWEGQVHDIESTPYVICDLTPYCKGCTFRLMKNPIILSLNRIEPLISANDRIAITEDGTNYILKGLLPDTYYDIKAEMQVKANGVLHYEEFFSQSFKTGTVKVQSQGKTMQASIEINSITATEDTTAIATEYGVMLIDDKEYPMHDRSIILSDLQINSTYNLRPYVVYEDGDTVIGGYNAYHTQDIYLNCYSSSKTQTTIKVLPYASTDETVNVEVIGVVHNGYLYPKTNESIEFQGLVNNRSYSFSPYIKYNGGKVYYGSAVNIATLSIQPQIEVSELKPTSVHIHGMYSLGTAHLEKAWFVYNDQNIESNDVIIRGLDPGKTYSIRYYVMTKEGGLESREIGFSTPSVNFAILQPKCVSPSCAIVAATTNISEEEVNVGFQWKKYDAPSSLAPKEGYASIYNGQLEGYIKNLQSVSYYNVRAFYKSDAGNYYYSDWVTFDPSDYSYFEPTVHTYEAVEVGHNSAKVKAYVMAGTDEVVEQGFEYWRSATPGSKAVSVKAASQAESNVSTVLGTGQVMIVTLTDLQPNCAYAFRSFVKTASGTTYGEERYLVTESDPTGIGNVEYDVPTKAITGYYDLEGRKHNEPQKGVNIIRFSDGSARKVMTK